MNRRLGAVVVSILTLSLSLIAQDARQASVTLKAAQAAETIEQDLPKAITLYERALKEAGSNRALVPQILLQLAQSQSKAGRADESRATYERIVRDHPDSGEPARIARARLALLVAATSPAPSAKPSAAERVEQQPVPRLLSWAGVMSPDGRFRVARNPKPQRIISISDGTEQQLTGAAATGFSFVWSRDSKHLAYGADLGDGPDGPRTEIRTVEVDGTGDRPLVRHNGLAYPEAWSPNGNEILVTIESAPFKTVLVSAVDGKERPFMSVGASASHYEFSDDGALVVFERDSDILAKPVAGGDEYPLIQNPATDVLMGWVPGRSAFLFASTRAGSVDLWIANVSGGHLAGAPEKVFRDLRTTQLTPRGISPDGSVYFSRGELVESEVYVAAIDSRSGLGSSQGAAVSQSNVGRNLLPSWSPDGRVLAYASRALSDVRQYYFSQLTLLNLSSDAERIVPLEPYADFRGPFAWSPDSQFVFVHGRVNGPGHTIYRVDVRTGVATPVVIKGTTPMTEVTPLAGGAVLYLSNQVVMKRHLDSGQEEMFFDPGRRRQLNSLAVSPDGKWLAMRASDQIDQSARLLVVSTEDRQAHDVVKYQARSNGGPGAQGAIAWASDSRYVYYVDAAADPDHNEVWRVPMAGGEPVRTGIAMQDLTRNRMSPDGKRLAFDTLTRTQGAMFVLDKLLSMSRR